LWNDGPYGQRRRQAHQDRQKIIYELYETADASGPDLGRSHLALQLPFCFEVRPLSCSLVGSAPKGPSDDVRGFDPRSMKSDGNAADFLE